MAGFTETLKKFFIRIGGAYRTVAGRSGGCAYIPKGGLDAMRRHSSTAESADQEQTSSSEKKE